MLRKTLLAIFLLFPLVINAQFNIGYNKSGKFEQIAKIKGDKLEFLKKTTTAFVVLDKDTPNIALFEQAIKSVWTITPFIIIRPFEISKYSDKKQYSIFKFRYEESSRQVSNGPHSTGARVTSMHLAYELWIADGKNKHKSHVIASAELYPDNELFWMFRKGDPRARNIDTRIDKDASKLIGNHLVYNWGAGFLKGYLKTIQDGLLAGKKRGYLLELADDARLSSLKNDTLYVPDYTLVKFSPFTGQTNDDTELDDEKLSDAYPYPVKFIAANELNKMILESNQSIKYLIYIKSSSKKIVNIYDSKDNQLIYTYVKSLSYNFKYKDLSKLAKEVKL